MGSLRHFMLILSFLVIANASEFVPVYMWGSHRAGEPIPALHKISQNTFKDEIMKALKDAPRIVVFAEHSLSPEDLGQRDISGNIAFPSLSKVQKTSKVTYLSYVQNPVKAIQHASEDVEEISIERLNKNDIPDSRIVIIDLNDAQDNERRFDMLKRHDEIIGSIYEELQEKYGNVLAVYTAHHPSWIASGVVHSRKTRALPTDDSSNKYMNNTTVLFYTSGNVVIKIGETTADTKGIAVTYSAENDNETIILSGKAPELSISFEFQQTVTGYWVLHTTNITYSDKIISQVTNGTIYAPLGFSYTCGNQTFKTTGFSIMFPNFQVQPMFKGTYLTQLTKFDDPYNCVGFTTIPIWSGLFVTFILLLIMTFGLTMMMDIKTMDRFDDAKGKTITINTSE
ncbi:V-type proton ATPase subunit S1 [Euwallacea fornicatus]|uniref:V-type proton ATPase subunit S1 n=1 Tax=Euwallacea fornicatus TaxID=995702 RepID=UPI00339041FB